MSKTLYIDRSEGGIIIRRKNSSLFCCCDTECCMYPADKLGVEDGYTEDDLPAAVYVIVLGEEGVFTRSGSVFSNDEIFSPDVFRIEILDDEYWPKNWYVTHDEGVLDASGCLVFEGTPAVPAPRWGTATVTDLFADTYTVGAVTLTRQSVCKWTGTGFTLRMTGIEWTLNGTSKTSGNQSTPTGIYTAGTVS